MKIAIIGYGLEGVSAYNYLSRLHPDASFEIYDSAAKPKLSPPSDIPIRYGVTDFHNIDADMVIRTPAISPSRITTEGEVSSVTKLFFANCTAPIVGITGTKGKGTTATLTASILKEAGIKTWLVGNIGLPALDVIDEINQSVLNGETCVVVYELSSFQLWDLEQSPQVAVVLMVEPEHLDVHDNDMENYVEAKQNIASHQHKEDVVIYFAANPISSRIAESSPGKKLPYIVNKDDDAMYVDDQYIIAKKDIVLLGEHNVGNIQAAMLAAWQFTQNKEAFARAVSNFQGLPHRLERVRKKNEVLFINDSFASAPPATLAAIRTFSNPKILIMGGFDRGLNFEPVAADIAEEKNLKEVLLIGQTGPKIAQALEKAGVSSFKIVDNLQDAVRQAYAAATPGDVVLLSPGCASFDMFKDFTERGNEFKRLVEDI